MINEKEYVINSRHINLSLLKTKQLLNLRLENTYYVCECCGEILDDDNREYYKIDKIFKKYLYEELNSREHVVKRLESLSNRKLNKKKGIKKPSYINKIYNRR